MEISTPVKDNSPWLDKPVFSFWPKFTIEHLLIASILIIAVITRLYNLGARDISFDEVNHVVPSFELYTGQGYVHNPITHGPLQFHLIAASYFLFGDSDFSSRIPSAVFSILTIAFILFAFKRYLGRVGSLVAGTLYLISPMILFYGRYARDEALLGLFGVMLFFYIFFYLEKGRSSSLLIIAALLSLQMTTEETAYIYTAILLIFLGVLFLEDVSRKHWRRRKDKQAFSFAMAALILLAGLGVAASAMEAKANSTTQPFKSAALQSLLPVYQATLIACVALAAIALVVIIYTLLKGLGWNKVKEIRSFDLLLLTFTLILPTLTAFPVKFLGWDPIDYSQAGLIHTSIILVLMTLIAIVVGLLWKPSLWLTSAAIFYAIFTVFYTTFFTNGQGFFTGIVGSLGYWLSQQSVNRGTQPWYYYLFLQLPMYDYLGVAGLILGAIYAGRHKLYSMFPGIAPIAQPAEQPLAEVAAEPIDTAETEIVENVAAEGEALSESSGEPIETEENAPRRLPVMAFFVYFSVMSLIAYSIAGEKMPWLTYYIDMPILLGAGWGIGYLIESVPWPRLANRKGLFALLLAPIFLVSLFMAIGILVGPNKPFQGTTLDQLQTTSTFLFSVLACGLSAWGVLTFLHDWASRDLWRLLGSAFFLVLAILTAHSSYQANYLNYDYATEFLVYAHGAPGPKQILSQVEEISERTTGGKDIKVAYLGDNLYPYWWYFRDYPNKMWIKDDVSKELLNYPLVIADDTTLSKTQSILGDNYVQYDYKRLWWPMMDYMNLTPERVWNAVRDPQMLEALWDIWFNKDYTLYGTLTNNKNLTLATWQPSSGMHFFIKKDIVSQIWEYGSSPVASTTSNVDPYANNYVELSADAFFGQAGTGNGQFADAHGIAVAPDGTIYVTDSNNNRVEHFTADGQFINAWGTLGSVDEGTALDGTFKEPWGIAVGPDGSVYVADTWNYRVQKFSADGKFLAKWGVPGQGESPNAFWGPRGIAVDLVGNVYVTDTGNKRVVVFDANGNYITEFGSYGSDPGQFDEPVGIAVDNNGVVYVADTWNKRIQAFAPDGTGKGFTFSRMWDVDAWDSQSTENKPFLAVDTDGHVYASDPAGYRVLEFTSDGQIVRVWGQYSSGIDGFGNPVGVALDGAGHLWVMDSTNSYALRFSVVASNTVGLGDLPALPTSQTPLSFDSSTNTLVDADHVAYYQLDASMKIWVPVVPESVSKMFSEALYPIQDASGNWTLKTKDNTTVYEWNANTLTWQLLAPVQATTTN